MRCGNCRRTRGVIAVAVCDDDSVEPCRAEGRLQIRQMPRVADAGVNERRRAAAAGQQVRVVAGSGHRTGIVGGEEERLEARHRT
jgi:hypothetical protein